MLRRYGGSDVLRELREQALDGRVLGCIATSERANGSDARSIETVAVQDDDGWHITGEKRYVSLGAADFVLVLARGTTPRTHAIAPALSLFIVPSGGYEVTDAPAERRQPRPEP